jgi:hypothetical protein
MTEAEVLEMINLHASNSMSAYTIFITFTFAYLAVAYFEGDKLSLSQVFIVSVLYVTSAVVFMIVAQVHVESFEALVSQYPDFIYSRLWWFPWSLVSPSLAAGGVLASLYFMWNARHPKTE